MKSNETLSLKMKQNSITSEYSSKNTQWKQIFDQSFDFARKNLDSDVNLAIIGQKSAGKSSLTQLLAQNSIYDPINSVLTYNHARIIVDNTVTHLNILMLDPNPSNFKFFKPTLSAENIIMNNIIFVIVVDISNPGQCLNFLNEWISKIKDSYEILKLTDDNLKDIMQSIKQKFSNIDSFNIDNFIPTNISENLGIPIILIGNHCDKLDSRLNGIQRGQMIKNALQYQLRKWCYENRAALIYTSCKDKTNLDAFTAYIGHLASGSMLYFEPQINDTLPLFIPIGWDNLEMLEVLRNKITDIVPDDPISKYFPPASITNNPTIELKIYPLPDDDEFKANIKECLNTLKFDRLESNIQQQAHDSIQLDYVNDKIQKMFVSKMLNFKDFNKDFDSNMMKLLKDQLVIKNL